MNLTLNVQHYIIATEYDNICGRDNRSFLHVSIQSPTYAALLETFEEDFINKRVKHICTSANEFENTCRYTNEIYENDYF